MVNLLRKPLEGNKNDGLRVIQHVTNENSPLKYVELKIIDLEKNEKYSETMPEKEVCIVALTGKINVSDGENFYENIGTRTSVFEKKPTDSVYISHNHTFEVTAVTNARVVLCYSLSNRQLPTRLIEAKDVGIEYRGAYSNKRLVHNILTDQDEFANSLLVVEVYTDSGNWSSYPPHKHDQDQLPLESLLEETYYHELNPKQGFVFQRVYTDDRSIDETMTVENGDVVIVPAGYHPVGVPDGYESYYLNVMAGPKRIWKFYNDPAHEWILNRK
ncbi:5-deoxy-glucuronate isomerase [Caldifermentibacillus hisashii]|uniref:5-deoxy-glucuronate isomerase n=1 Tax=Caldifermentibacillus hisashii TaxID=996558 RepID=UPI003101AAD9